MPIAVTMNPTRNGQLFPPFPAGSAVAVTQQRHMVSLWQTQCSPFSSPVPACSVQPASDHFIRSNTDALHQDPVTKWCEHWGENCPTADAAHHCGVCAPCGFVAPVNFPVTKQANTSRCRPPSHQATAPAWPSSLSLWDCGAEQGVSPCSPIQYDRGQEGARPYGHL